MKSHFLLCVIALFITGATRWLSYSHSDYLGELFIWLSTPFMAAAVYYLVYPIRRGALRVFAILVSSIAMGSADLRVLHFLRVDIFEYIPEITFLEVSAVYWLLNFPAVLLFVVFLEVRRLRSSKELVSAK
jgi:hypothetical protein